MVMFCLQASSLNSPPLFRPKVILAESIGEDQQGWGGPARDRHEACRHQCAVDIAQAARRHARDRAQAGRIAGWRLVVRASTMPPTMMARIGTAAREGCPA